MATATFPMSSTVQRRRRVATYGKASRNPTHRFFGEAALLVDYEDDKSKASLNDSGTTNYSLNGGLRTPPNGSCTPPATCTLRSSNEFDVPSSDEDNMPSRLSSCKKHTMWAAVSEHASAGYPNMLGTNDIQTASVSIGTASGKRKRGAHITLVQKAMQVAEQDGGRSLKLLAQSEDLQMRATVKPDERHPDRKLRTERLAILPSRIRVKRTSSENATLRKSKAPSAPLALRSKALKLANGSDTSNSPVEPKVQTCRPSEFVQASVTSTLPSTPPRSVSSSPHPAPSSRKPITTPRQAQLWKQLLDSDDIPATPSLFKVHSLNLAERQPFPEEKGPRSSEPKALLRGYSDLSSLRHRPKIRLIDRLVQEQDSASEQTDSEDEEGEQATDAVRNSFQVSQPWGSDRPTYNVLLHSQGSNGASGEYVGSSAVPSAASRPTMTYARQRSHLTEASNDFDSLLHTSLAVSAVPARPPYQERRTRQREPMDEPGDEEDTGGKMRSIHELRAAGGSTRFMDDMNSILDDFEDRRSAARSKRRSAALEISSKLVDKHLVGAFTAHGYEQRLFANVPDETDPVTKLALTVSVAVLVNADTTPRTAELIQRSGAISMLTSQLEDEQDIIQLARARPMNMSKVAQGSLVEFRKLILIAFNWSLEEPINVSPSIVSLKALELLTRRLREARFSGDVLDRKTISNVTALVGKNIPKPMFEGDAFDAVLTLELCLSILESGILMSQGRFEDSPDHDPLIVMMTDSFPFVFQPVRASQSESTAPDDRGPNRSSAQNASARSVRASQLQTLALRLTLNLTNNNASVCHILGRATLGDAIIRFIITKLRVLESNYLPDERLLAVDSLILSLGVMINLAEWSKTARLSVITQGEELLKELVGIFFQAHNIASEVCSEEESHSNVAYGYLAVLLGNLCMSKKIRAIVRSKLPGGRLDLLVASIEEFIQYHEKVDQELGIYGGNDGRDVWAAFTARLQYVADRLKAI